MSAFEDSKTYLGDSVYAAFDGYNLVLTTENGEWPSNTIYLEPVVFEALKRYVQRIREVADYGSEKTE